MAHTILVVEDDAALRHAIERNLTARGHAVRLAGTVAAAQEIVDQDRPDLILLDVELPDGSGWDVLRALGDENCGDIPVIIMSAFRPNTRLFEEMRCRGVLEKPFPMEALLRIVSDQLGERANKEN